MTRSAQLNALLLAAAIAGCEAEPAPFPVDDDDTGDDDDDAVPGKISLDTSAVVDGRYGEVYSAQLVVTGTEEPVQFHAVDEAALPPGLELTVSGLIEGVPEWCADYSFDVVVQDLDGVQLVTGSAAMSIGYDGVDGVFLGYVHDRVNNLTWRFGLARDMWVRVGGDPTWVDYTWDPGVYVAGPDGIASFGGPGPGSESLGDDVRIADLEHDSVSIELAEWFVTEQQTWTDSNYPSMHLNEGTPPTYEGGGLFRAGADTGEAMMRVSAVGLPDTIVRLFVWAPDFCPEGEHEGGWNRDGSCM